MFYCRYLAFLLYLCPVWVFNFDFLIYDVLFDTGNVLMNFYSIQSRINRCTRTVFQRPGEWILGLDLFEQHVFKQTTPPPPFLISTPAMSNFQYVLYIVFFILNEFIGKHCLVCTYLQKYKVVEHFCTGIYVENNNSENETPGNNLHTATNGAYQCIIISLNDFLANKT